LRSSSLREQAGTTSRGRRKAMARWKMTESRWDLLDEARRGVGRKMGRKKKESGS